MIKLEDLQSNNFYIYQDKDSFNFGIDAVLLANFALKNLSVNKNEKENYKINFDYKICDLCSGSLPIPLIIYSKKEKYFKKRLNIDAFEIDEDQVSLSKKSLSFNNDNLKKYSNDFINILNDINVYNEDIKNIILNKEKYKNIYETYDAITCNPPYIKYGSGLKNLYDKKIIARHEVTIDFDSVCKVACALIKPNKKFFIINHSDRFTEMIETLKKYSFSVKKAAFVYPYINKNSNLVLIEAVKYGKEGIKILKPLVIYKENGEITDNINEFYKN